MIRPSAVVTVLLAALVVPTGCRQMELPADEVRAAADEISREESALLQPSNQTLTHASQEDH